MPCISSIVKYVSHMYCANLSMFTFMSCLQDDPMAINEIRDDLRQECEKFGVVKKILIFDVSRWSRE